MKLSPLQKKILDHRLEVPDALAEAIGLDADEFISEVCANLIVGNYLSAMLENPATVRALLVDCVEGSTYWAASQGWGDATDLQLANITRAGQALARKVSKFTGHDDLEFPTW
tara:strand:+ start:6821 stop:7159 length:339 start_codon:yes stop_codon:yes gene_type:complete